jgi:hypothetical protein
VDLQSSTQLGRACDLSAQSRAPIPHWRDMCAGTQKMPVTRAAIR